MIPGAYLALRRAAAGLSVEDVAARLRTEPPVAELARVALIRAIEGGTAPASFATIVALRAVFRFDLDVLAQLVERDLGLTDWHPRICRGCGCSQVDPCRTGEGPCAWVDVTARPAATLCTACQTPDRSDAI